jgi:chromosome segregation ATPase
MANNDNSVTIGVRIEGTKEAAEQLRELIDGTREVGTTAKESSGGTQELAQAFDTATESVRGIVDGVRESQTTLDEQRAALEGVRDALKDAKDEFGKSETAAKQFDAMLAEVTEELARLEEQARSAGSATVDGTTRHEAALSRLREELDRVQKKFTDGAVVSKRDIDRVTAAQINLQQEIRDTGKTVDQLGPEFKQTFDIAQQEIDETRQRFVQMDEQMQRHRRSLNEAGAQWQGFGQTVMQMLGPMGAKVGILTIAIREIWRVSNDLATTGNKLFGTDMAEWTRITDQLGISSEALTMKLQMLARLGFDELAIGLRGLIALLSGNFAEASRIAEEHTALQQEKLEALKLAFTGSREEIERYTGKLKESTEAAKVETEATEQAAEAKREAAQAIAAHGRALSALAKEIENVINAEDASRQALKATSMARDEAFLKMAQYGEVVGGLSNQLGILEGAQRKAAEEVRELTATRQAGDPILEEAIRKEKNATTAVEQHRAKLSQAQTTLRNSEQAYDTANTAIEGHQKKVEALATQTEELSQAYGALHEQGPKLAGTLEQVNTPTEALAASAGNAAKALGTMAEVAPVASQQMAETRHQVELLAEALDKLTVAAERAAGNIHAASVAGLEPSVPLNKGSFQ